MAREGTPLPFDNSGHRAIFVDTSDWKSIESARAQLIAQAKRTEEAGYSVSNPITQANASFRMQDSSDPTEKVIADLLARVQFLETGRRMAAAIYDLDNNAHSFLLDVKNATITMKNLGNNYMQIVGFIANLGTRKGYNVNAFNMQGDWIEITVDGVPWRVNMTDGNVVQGERD